MTPDEKLRAIARLMLGGLLGQYGVAVTIDCASDEDAEELFGLLESVGLVTEVSLVKPDADTSSAADRLKP